MKKKARRIRHRCPETDSIMIMKFHTKRNLLDDVDEVEFWYDSQATNPTIFDMDQLIEGFDKAGYILTKKTNLLNSEPNEQES